VRYVGGFYMGKQHGKGTMFFGKRAVNCEYENGKIISFVDDKG
jgi:hypothetical protein